MRTVVLVTCDRWPELSASDGLYAAALAARGLEVRAAPWNGPQEPFEGAALVVLRSNWDYHYTPDLFAGWIAGLERRGTALCNPPGLVRWNLDKGYLLELAARRVPIPATFVASGGAPAVADILAAQRWRQAVVKPAIGASGHAVRLVSAAALPSVDELPVGPRLLVQEYMAEVQKTGELSCVFFDGAYSHTFVRRPRAEEFRVNSQYAGIVERAQPPQAVVAQARAILAVLPHVPLYARVDGVVRDGQFILMELELNEPSLRLDLNPRAADQFAEATLRRLPG